MCLVFSEEPVGPLYRELVDFCCSVATELMLVVREPAPPIEEALRHMRPDFLRAELVYEWPGTILLHGGQATAHWYMVSHRLRENLKALADGLFEWVGFRPEDPCFLRANGQVLLVTTSHERDAYMFVTKEERESLERDFPRLASILSDEGDAKCRERS